MLRVGETTTGTKETFYDLWMIKSELQDRIGFFGRQERKREWDGGQDDVHGNDLDTDVVSGDSVVRGRPRSRHWLTERRPVEARREGHPTAPRPISGVSMRSLPTPPLPPPLFRLPTNYLLPTEWSPLLSVNRVLFLLSLLQRRRFIYVP